MNRNNSFPNMANLMTRRPHAWANITGHAEYPDLRGQARFYQTPYGVLIVVEFEGLPNPEGNCDSPVFGFHIHQGERCAGNSDDPFFDVGNHFNPYDCPHPYHAGDLPPIFGVDGYAFSAFLTDRFSVEDVIGRTVILHASPDDFMTQPSGNSGMKIACGVIRMG